MVCYNCFGCSPDNEAGVRMEFYEDGDEVVSIWKPRPEYQGWLNTLHGGIQSVLLDEICGWVVFRKLQTGGVTSKMETRFSDHSPGLQLTEYHPTAKVADRGSDL